MGMRQDSRNGDGCAVTSIANITIIGCGIPAPTPERCGSAYERDRCRQAFFDCDPGTICKLSKVGCSPADFDDVFFTDHHFDHDAEFAIFLLSC